MIGLCDENLAGIGEWFSCPFGKCTVEIWLIDGKPEHEDYDGIFRSSSYRMTVNEDGTSEVRLPNAVGYIELYTDYMGGGYVAHELTHALLNYKAMIDDGDNLEADDEHYCEVMQEATTFIWNKFFEYVESEE